MKYSFTIPGQAVPKERPRLCIRGGRRWVYTPKKTQDYENKVRFSARRAGIKTPLQGALIFTLRIFNKDRRRRDCDNIEKGIRDALNKLAYQDDSQIKQKNVAQVIDPEDPRCEVELEEMS